MKNTLTEVIDWILRITGLLTITIGSLSIVFKNNEYEENILIKRVRNIDDINNDLHYFHEYIDDEISGELTLIKPNRCKIKNVKVYSLKFEKGKLKKDRCLKQYNNITPNEGVLFNIYYSEGIPMRMIEWKCDYGIRGQHIFSENGFNGNVDVKQYCYNYGIISNLRKKFDFK